MKIVISILFLVFYTNGFADSAKEIFEQGMFHEETSGNLKQAVRLYAQSEKLGADQPRLAAKSLYHRALCYFKMGQTDKAGELFGSLIEKYSEQKEICAKLLNHLDINDKPQIQKSAMMKSLEMIVPRFKQSGTLPEVIKQLAQITRTLDPERNGLNIIDLITADKQNKTYNYDFENMPAGEIIRYICISSNMVYKVEDKAVIIATSDAIINDMQSDFYYISEGLLDLIKNKDFSEDVEYITKNKNKKQEDIEELFKNYFIALGITFPKGSSILFLKTSPYLYIRNTKQNQQKLKEIFKQLSFEIGQIKFRAKLIEVLDEKFMKSLSNTTLSYEDLMKIPLSKRKTLSSLSCLAVSGITVTMSDLNEMYSASKKNKGEKLLQRKEDDLVPEYGSKLTIFSQLDPDGFTISLDIRWKFSEIQKISGEIKELIAEKRINLTDGATLLLQVQGKGSKDDKNKNLFLVFQVDLVDKSSLKIRK